jgi:hypothetical protein
MKLGTIKRISKEDMSKQGDVPKWMDPMLDTLNEFIEKVSQALLGNLTFEDNFLCKVVEQEFTHATEVIVSPRIDGRSGLRAVGVLPTYPGGEELDSFSWVTKENGNLGVTFWFGTSTTAKCRILILLR